MNLGGNVEVVNGLFKTAPLTYDPNTYENYQKTIRFTECVFDFTGSSSYSIYIIAGHTKPAHMVFNGCKFSTGAEVGVYRDSCNITFQNCQGGLVTARYGRTIVSNCDSTRIQYAPGSSAVAPILQVTNTFADQFYLAGYAGVSKYYGRVIIENSNVGIFFNSADLGIDTAFVLVDFVDRISPATYSLSSGVLNHTTLNKTLYLSSSGTDTLKILKIGQRTNFGGGELLVIPLRNYVSTLMGDTITLFANETYVFRRLLGATKWQIVDQHRVKGQFQLVNLEEHSPDSLLAISADGKTSAISWQTATDTIEYQAGLVTSVTTGTTDASGDITVGGPQLGTDQYAVVVTVTGTTLRHVTVHSKDASQFKVRFFDSTGTVLGAGVSVSCDILMRKIFEK